MIGQGEGQEPVEVRWRVSGALDAPLAQSTMAELIERGLLVIDEDIEPPTLETFELDPDSPFLTTVEVEGEEVHVVDFDHFQQFMIEHGGHRTRHAAAHATSLIWRKLKKDEGERSPGGAPIRFLHLEDGAMVLEPQDLIKPLNVPEHWQTRRTAHRQLSRLLHEVSL